MALQPGLTGRKVRVKKGPLISAVALIGVKQEDISIANSEVDVTDKGDSGYRTLLNDWGTRSLDVSLSGVLKSEELIAICMSSSGAVLLQDYTISITGIGNFEGDFYLNGLQLGAPHDNAVTFSGTLMSSGVYTFVAT